jgi:hypothetical protein
LVDLNGNRLSSIDSQPTKHVRSLSPTYINVTKLQHSPPPNTVSRSVVTIKNKTPVTTFSSNVSRNVVNKPQLLSCCSSLSSSSSSTCSNSRIFEAKEIYISSTIAKQNNYITTSTHTHTAHSSGSLSPSSSSSYPVENYSPRLLTSSNTLTTHDQQLIMSRAVNSTSNGASAGYSLVDPNKIHLFVKAGQDGRSQGACPFCQDVFLQLLIKAQTNKFNFDVITINLDNPPKEFKELSIKPPVLIHGSNRVLRNGQTDLDGSDCSDGEISIVYFKLFPQSLPKSNQSKYDFFEKLKNIRYLNIF